VITDAGGIPLAASLTGGNRNDITQLLPLIEAIPSIAGTRGRPRHRPSVVYADRAYDHDKYRRLLRAKGIGTRIARRGQPHGSSLGTIRWVVERTIAWYHGFRRLRTRWERRDDIHEAFLGLATCIITYRRLTALC
jgi:transposase